jgi:hypothetical protein
VDKTRWTVMDACDDGVACTSDACDITTGVCGHVIADGKCLINGACLADGQSGPAPCEVCSAAANGAAWSSAPDGTACGIGGKCRQGACCVPACGDKSCGDDGCGGTCGTCELEFTCTDGQCEPTTSCSVATCPVLQGYSVTCNAKKHCEYANITSTGWKAYDVWILVAAQSSGTPFLIGKYEVPVSVYEACVAASGCTPAHSTIRGEDWGVNTSAKGRSDHPQNALDWYHADYVCSWLGGRLPTLDEWYFAAGTNVAKYPWGDSPEPDCYHAVFDQDSVFGRPWSCDPCTVGGCSGTKPVGSKVAGASPCGALDMIGNVGEWVQDTIWQNGSLLPIAMGGDFGSSAGYLGLSVTCATCSSQSSGTRCVKALPK